jgi:hypothetical protein
MTMTKKKRRSVSPASLLTNAEQQVAGQVVGRGNL